MKKYAFTGIKPPLFFLLIFLVSILICCGAPAPRDYNDPENQEKLKQYTEDSTTIDGLQCDGIAKFEVVIGPREECFVYWDTGNCQILVKQERFLSNGGIDFNPKHIKLDTLQGLDTVLYEEDQTKIDHLNLTPKNEYFKITISCLDMLDGKCEPRLLIRKK